MEENCNYRPSSKQCISTSEHPLDRFGRQAYTISRGKCTDQCTEFTCPEHSTCHWDAGAKKAQCPCDAGYLAAGKSQCVRVTDGAPGTSSLVDVNYRLAPPVDDYGPVLDAKG